MSRYAPIAPLSPAHDRSSFDSGSDPQTTWLRDHALAAQQADTARVYVVTRANETQVVGYYALSAGSVSREGAPVRLTQGTGRYPVPVVVLTRLGVDLAEQGSGVGAALVRDALMQTALIAERIGVRALLIHAENEEAVQFYQHLTPEFERSPTDPLHLILLVKDLRRAVRQAAEIRQASAG